MAFTVLYGSKRSALVSSVVGFPVLLIGVAYDELRNITTLSSGNFLDGNIHDTNALG